MLQLSSTEITSWLGSFLWPLFRIAALFSVMPVIGGRTVPVRIRLGLSVIVTVLVFPTLPPAPAFDALSPVTILIIAQQVLIGLMMGFALRLVFSAIENGGQVVGMMMGLGFASMIDPQNGIQVPVVSQFYTLLITLVFLALNGHLVLIEVLAGSFQTLPIAPQGVSPTTLWQLLEWAKWIFSGALLIAFPAIGAMLVVNMAFGVMTRAAPQLNIFVVGFPITLLTGFVIMMLALPSSLPQFRNLIDGAFGLVHRIVLGAG